MRTDAIKRKLEAVVDRLCGPIPPPDSEEFERWFSRAADFAIRAHEHLDCDPPRNESQEECDRAAFEAVDKEGVSMSGRETVSISAH